MSNKKETPVSWLKHSIEDLIANDIGSQVKFKNKVIHALEMESKKQQKYDEMLGMLDELINLLEENQGEAKFYTRGHYIGLKQLIKEAKEL
jgi:hypothetical protein